MKTIDQIQLILNRSECLYDFKAVNTALDRMATAITQQLKSTRPLVLCVMTGALITVGPLFSLFYFSLKKSIIPTHLFPGVRRVGKIFFKGKKKRSQKMPDSN